MPQFNKSSINNDNLSHRPVELYYYHLQFHWHFKKTFPTISHGKATEQRIHEVEDNEETGCEVRKLEFIHFFTVEVLSCSRSRKQYRS